MIYAMILSAALTLPCYGFGKEAVDKTWNECFPSLNKYFNSEAWSCLNQPLPNLDTLELYCDPARRTKKKPIDQEIFEFLKLLPKSVKNIRLYDMPLQNIEVQTHWESLEIYGEPFDKEEGITVDCSKNTSDNFTLKAQYLKSVIHPDDLGEEDIVNIAVPGSK